MTKSRQGFTLIEGLIVLFILSVLISLFLPAVQSAREAGRRLQCANHLKQIGIALHSYSATHTCFPAILSESGTVYIDIKVPIYAHSYSPSARMLADLDHRSLYDAVNFERITTQGPMLQANQTVMLTSVGLFLCPSDVITGVPGFGRNNYRYNVGATPWIAPGHNASDSWVGPFTPHRFHREADFLDGLSNTVGVSERLQGGWLKGNYGTGDYMLTIIGREKNNGGPNWAVAECAAAVPGVAIETRSGESWFLSGHHFTTYNHCSPPNAKHNDCSFIETREPIHNRTLHEGVFTARSYHPGGVNVLLMDGGVRFVADSISIQLWRALATRSEGEVVAGWP